MGLAAGRDRVVDRLMENPKFRKALGDGDDGRRRAERMVGARQESMRAMLEIVDEKWGGAEGYVKNVVGLSDEDIERVRKVMRC